MGDKIFRSAVFNGDFDQPNCSLFEYEEQEIKKKVEEDPDWICMIDGSTDVSIKIKDVLPMTRRVASGLAKVGFCKRDVLCLVTENRCQVFYCLLATLASGGSLATLVPYLPQDQLEKLLEQVGPKVVMCCDSSETTIRSIKATGMLKNVLVYSFDDSHVFPTFQTLIEDDGKAYPSDVQVDLKSDPIIYLPTSGTTGLPKIIQHSNFNFVATFMNTDNRFHGEINGRTLVLCCYYHFSGIFFSLGQITKTTLIILSKPPHTARSILSCIEKYKVDSALAFPFQVAMLANCAESDEHNWSSLRLLLTGGSKLHSNDRLNFERTYPGVKLVEVYATSETILVANPLSDLNRRAHEGSVGTLECLVEAKVVDCNDGVLVGPGQAGEICFRTPCLMIGYKGAPELTKEVIDENGFYHTGDIGWIDENGEVFITDRIKNFIKFQTKETSIITICSTNVENVILGHPDVLDAGVCNASHPEFQEVPRAYVKLRAGAQITEEYLMIYANGQLDDIHQIRGGLKFVDEIPRNYNGKIMRNKLKLL